MLFTCIKSWFFRNHLASFHQISHWSFCWNVIDSLFKWSCFIDCQAHIFFFKTKNCSLVAMIGLEKMLHNICMSAVGMSLRWANRGPWASCLFLVFIRSSLQNGFQCTHKICFHWEIWWISIPFDLEKKGTNKNNILSELWIQELNKSLFYWFYFCLIEVGLPHKPWWFWVLHYFLLWYFEILWLIDLLGDFGLSSSEESCQ